jgi:hypothetical protein
MNYTHTLQVIVVWFLLHAAVLAQPRVAITREQVIAAVRRSLAGTQLAGVDFRPDQMSMPLSMFSRAENTDIVVLQVVVDGRRRILDFRMGCAHSDCLSFFVRITPDEFPEGYNGTVTTVTRSNHDSSTATGAVRVKVLKAGSRATLRVAGAGLNMSVPVTCLDAGSENEVIRARVGGSGQVIRAVVQGPGLLVPAAVETLTWK